MSDDLLSQLFALDKTENIRHNYIRAPFGYPGSKSRSVKNLLEILPYRKVWVDAFAGSGAVTLARNESDLEIFNDRHAGITAFFRCVKDPVKCKKLADWIDQSVCSREEFIFCKETWNNCNWLDDVERAARWFYCVQNSFNSKGWIFGRCTSGRSQCQKMYNNIKNFWPCQQRLRKVYIENIDYKQLIDDINKNKANQDGRVVYYLDPPYWKTNAIYDYNFKDQEHYELAERCMHLNGFIALSGYDCENHPYNKFKWTNKYSWNVYVSANGMAYHETNHLEGLEEITKRGIAVETLWVRDV